METLNVLCVPNNPWKRDNNNETDDWKSNHQRLCGKHLLGSVLPCLLLWLLLLIRIRRNIKPKSHWTVRTLCRMLIASLLFVLELQKFIRISNKPFPSIVLHSTLAETFTWLLIILFVYFERQFGLQYRWTFIAFGLSLSLRDVIILTSGFERQSINTIVITNRSNYTQNASETSPECLLHLMLNGLFVILNLPFPVMESQAKFSQKYLPIYTASLFSRLTLWWMNDLISLGYRRALTSSDVWRLNPQDKALNLYRKYQCRILRRFEFSLPFKSKSFSSIEDDRSSIKSPDPANAVKSNPLPIAIIRPTSFASKNDDHYIANNLIYTLLQTFWPHIIFNALFRFVALIVHFINPLLLKGLIRHLESGGSFTNGIPYAFGFIAVAFISSMFNNQYEVGMLILNVRMRSVLSMLLFNKILSISPAVRQDFTNGEIVNLISADADRLSDYIPTFNQMWATTIQIIISLVMLFNEIGIAFVGAVAVGLLIIPVNAIVTTRMKKMQKELMARKDNRLKILSEILSNVKVLKFYGWEESFQRLILAIRATELVMLRKRLKYMTYTVFSYSLIPFLMSLLCFGIYLYVDPNNVLTTSKAFVTISLINILRVPLGIVPSVISSTVMFRVALRRVVNFMKSDDLQKDAVKRGEMPTVQQNKTPLVEVRNGWFSWDRNGTFATLRNIDMQVFRGQLVAVVGSVGSGKTSLLHALLGEMKRCSGHVQIRGKLAYVSQQAWLQDTSLYENVLFGRDYRPNDYEAILKACQLEEDIRSLSRGDQTNVGERGASLSGGQRQRLCLARAAYTKADVFLFDDPLSALDARVGRQVFEQLIGPKGLLRDSARLLITHRLSVLPQAQHIVVLDEGRIVESGSYEQLLSRRGQFAQFLLAQLSTANAHRRSKLNSNSDTANNNEFGSEDDEELKAIEHIRRYLQCTMQMPIQNHIFYPTGEQTTIGANHQTDNASNLVKSTTTLNATQAITTTQPSSSCSLSSQSTLGTNLTINSNEFGCINVKYVHNTMTSAYDQRKACNSTLPTPEPFRRFCEEGAFARESNRSRASTRSLLATNTIGRRSISSLTEATEAGAVETEEYNEPGCADPDQEDAEEQQMEQTLRKSNALQQHQEWLSANKMQDNPEHIRVGRIPTHVLQCYAQELRVSQLIVTMLLFLLAYMASMYSSLWLSAWSADRLLSCNPSSNSPTSFNRTATSSSSTPTVTKSVDCLIPVSSQQWFNLFLLQRPQMIPGNSIRLIVYASIGFFECTMILFANRRLGTRIQEAASAVFQRMLFGLLDTPLHVLESIPIGRLLTRFSRDQDVLDFIVWLNARATIQNGLKALVAIILVTRQSWFLLPVILPLLFLYFGIRSFFLRSRRQLTRLQLAARAPVQGLLIDTLSGTSNVRAFRAEPRFEAMFAERVDQANELQIPSALSSRWLTVRLELIGNLLVIGAVMAALTNNDPENAIIAALAITSALTVTNTMSLLVRVSSEMEANMLSVERCLDYTRFPSEKSENESKVPPPDWPNAGRIVFENFCCSYDTIENPIIRDVSIEIRAGEKVAVIGRSGAGKSSLTLALFRLMPETRGCIRIDDIDLNSLDRRSFRSRLTIIPQEPLLLSGSLRLNLDPFNVHSDNQLYHVLRQANLNSFAVPGGLELQLVDSGSNWSVGQRQQLCLARALLNRSKVLVLDEATASLDPQTEQLIQNTIQNQFSDCTVVAIAHRLNFVFSYSRVLVLEGGQVVEFDSPKTLMERKQSAFYALAKESGLV